MAHLLTIEAVAEILSVHTRTVRRYIKENKLPAQKVGGQWRVLADDLKTFLGADSFADIANRPKPDPETRTYDSTKKERIVVSAVVDIHVGSKDEALRLSSTILAAMNSPHEDEQARCDQIFFEEEGRLRFMLWGSPTFMKVMMGMFQVLTDNDKE